MSTVVQRKTGSLLKIAISEIGHGVQLDAIRDDLVGLTIELSGKLFGTSDVSKLRKGMKVVEAVLSAGIADAAMGASGTESPSSVSPSEAAAFLLRDGVRGVAARCSARLSEAFEHPSESDGIGARSMDAADERKETIRNAPEYVRQRGAFAFVKMLRSVTNSRRCIARKAELLRWLLENTPEGAEIKANPEIHFGCPNFQVEEALLVLFYAQSGLCPLTWHSFPDCDPGDHSEPKIVFEPPAHYIKVAKNRLLAGFRDWKMSLPERFRESVTEEWALQFCVATTVRSSKRT